MYELHCRNVYIIKNRAPLGSDYIVITLTTSLYYYFLLPKEIHKEVTMEYVNLWIPYTLALIAIPTVAQFEFNPYELFGCFDKDSNQFASIDTGVFVGRLTLQTCRESCKSRKATYFGVSEGNRCWCFRSVILRSPTSVPQLTFSCYGENAKRCEGDEHQYCGADDAYLIYSVCPPGSYGENCDQVCSCSSHRNLCTFDRTCYGQLCYPGYEYKGGPGCNVCEQNKYGFKCTKDCPLGCPNNCDRKSGVYNSCISGKGPYCLDTCPTDTYGPNCKNICTSRCLEGKCNHDNGHCTACKESSSWGDACDHTCPIQCSPQECDIETGVCKHGCNDGYYGDYCNITCPLNCHNNCKKSSGDCTNGCESNNWEVRCNSTCPENCVDGCNQTNGACISCSNGWHGDFCNMSCPINCLDPTCDMDSGECDGCRDGWKGVICNETCLNNCLKCAQYGEEGNGNCEAGYCGDNCDEMCPTTTESLVTPTDVNDAKSDFPIAIVAGACAAVIVVIIVIIVIVLICCKRSNEETSIDLAISRVTPASTENVYE